MMSTSSPNDSPAEKPPMQFTLRSLLLTFVLVWASMALFGSWGILVAAYLLVFVICIRGYKSGYSYALGWLAGATLLLLALLLLLIACLLPSDAVHEAPRRANCLNNLKQIGLGLQNYESRHNCFPPAYIADADGKPMHSWRIQMLPYMECKPLYKQYDFDEPWDGPNNRRLADKMPKEYRCPSDPGGGTPYTNYVAVVGPETAWPGPVACTNIPDGTAHTIMVFEVSSERKFHWMEPRDITWDDIAHSLDPESEPRTAFSKHVYHPTQFTIAEWVGAGVCLADGSVQQMGTGQDPQWLRAMLTINGGENVYGDFIAPKCERRPNWPQIIASITALAVLLVSFGLMLFWPLRKTPIEPAAEGKLT